VVEKVKDPRALTDRHRIQGSTEITSLGQLKLFRGKSRSSVPLPSKWLCGWTVHPLRIVCKTSWKCAFYL